MDLGDYRTFCSRELQIQARNFVESIKRRDPELEIKCNNFINLLERNWKVFLSQSQFLEAEKCFTLALKAVEATSQQMGLDFLQFINVAAIWSGRSCARLAQEKYPDALKDAETSISINPENTNAYSAAFSCHKALLQYPKAAYCLYLALSRELLDNFETMIADLAITVSEMKPHHKEEFMQYQGFNIFINPKLAVWIQISKFLSDQNKFEALAILTTGLCDSCCIPSSLVHRLGSIPGLTFPFLNVGRMLKFLADKEGTKSWHLKLAEYVVKRGAKLSTVENNFNKPFLIAMTTLSVEGELPSFLSLAWEILTVEDYDQKDIQGNTALHTVAKHGKGSKSASEVICRDLIAHGCLASEVDAAGKCPHEYIPPGRTIHNMLKNAMITPNEGVHNRLTQIRENGRKALEEQKYDKAIELYQKALFIASKYSSFNSFAAVLHSNISAVHMKMEAYAEAVKYAENSLKADSTFYKGYLRLGQALLKLNNHRKACEAFISGFNGSSDDESLTYFSTEVAKILPHIPAPEISFIVMLREVLSYKGPEKIKTLTEKAMWVEVNSLYLGPPYEIYVTNTVNFRAGIMATCDASQAVLSTIFQALDNSAINAASLLTILIERGASPESLASSKETHFHAAVRICILTNSIQLLKCILENDKEKKIQSSKDCEGRTPLHTLCIEHNRKMPDTRLSAQIATWLNENKVDFNAKDKYQRTAADYDTKSQLKKILESIQSSTLKQPKDQKPSSTESIAECNKLKEQGNTAFKDAQYEAAYKLYSEAITVLEAQMQNPLYDLWTKEGRNLAILYGNRAECSNKLGDWKMFLDNAKQSVDADGSWYKGHWRVARACREMGKGKIPTAIKAFANSMRAIKAEEDKGLEKLILADFVETIYEQDDRDRFKEVLIETIGYWGPQIICHFITNKKWHMAEFVFGHCSSLGGHFENLSMGVLCDKQQCGQRWICALICKFLVAGVNHKTLKFHDGDTYFHATILIILKTGMSQISRIKPMETEAVQLLQFVVINKVLPSNELNIRDNKGNTVLHHLASLKEGHEKLREFVGNYLIEQGVDVMAVNHEKKLAFDLASNSDVVKAILQHYMNNLKLIEKLKNQPKQDSYQPKQESQPQNSRQNNMKTADKVKSQPKQDSHPQNSRQKTAPESAQRTENPIYKPHSRCDACERKLKSAEDVPRKDKYYDVVLSLVQVSNCKNSNAAYHKGMTEKAIERIASLLAIYQPDIPSSVCKLSAKVFKVILTSLASSKHWALLEALVTRFRQAKGQSALPDFAKNISLTDLIKDRSLDSNRSERMNLINLLASGGVSLDAKLLASALEVAMVKEEWQVVIKLLEFGTDPRAMTLTPGDTPYHAALQVALNRQPGYFALLEKLKQLEDSQAANQAHLKVSCQDSDGNTLLHIAAQAKFSPYALHAVELLCQWNVLADIRNNENKLAIQCLPSDNDRRVQYLKSSAAGSTMPTSSKHSKIGATGEGFEAIPRTSAFNASWTALQVKRAQMEGTLLALPVAGINYLNLDNRAKKKVEPAESVDSNDSDEEKEFDGDMDPVMETTADDEAELSAEDLDIDVKAFELLAWDIECTEDVWSILRSRKEVTNYNKNERSEGKKHRKRAMPLSLKQVIVKRVQELASGNWEKPHFQQRITDTPDSLQLFKVALPHGAYILWELAIAFSPRLSESPETVLSAEQEDTIKGGSVARGSKMYSDVIRVWSIALKQSELQHVVRKIIDSHERGKSCIIQKSLEAKNNHLYNNTSSSRHIPNLYVEIDSDEVQNGEMVPADHKRLFPPASAHKNEYHVLKFYSFSSSLASAVLNNSDKNVDFPFRVTDLEHAFINLKSESPLLLLGRSGTGKTTCCLYRMWSKFMLYWEQAINHDTPMLQRRNYIPEIADNDEELQESQTTPEGKGATNYAVETGAAQQNGDSRDSQSDDSQQENAESEEDCGENAENNVFQYDHLHQLFVTKNPVLCMEVQKNFTKLYNGTEELQRNNVWQNTDLPNTFQDMGEFSFPLFVTSRQLLLILDASLDGLPFFPRDEDLALKVTIQGWGTQEDIFNIIPLEHDLFDSDDDDDDDAVKGAGKPGKMKRVHALGARPERKKFDRQECTHDVFTDIWPKITKKSKIDCHPSLVWTEIMSFIKGSYEALNTEKGYLDQAQYINVGRKRAPNFSGDRSKVYDVFLEYQKYKQKYALFDEADLVYRLYRRLRDMPFHPWVFHEIYVDETQDFTQAELALLVSLCSEPNKMFLTGDTAQSIMRGISFRFKDLQTLFFSVKESADKSEQHLAKLKVPQKVHQLRHNYRSHTGILSLASSVLDILLKLFEDSFDPLKRDQGMFAGPKPIIIESSSPEDLALLLTGSRRKTSHIEFGAHQAILVVDDAAKEKLPEELGAGIVLTIFESKGLEFDDVLIYNFFKDSQAKKEWRVVTNFLNTFQEDDAANNSKEGLVEIDADALAPSKSRPLAFDPNQHKVLNSELKHLYTAITRARVNVWIFDEDEEKRAPMFEYFRARGLVKSMGSQECANINEAITFADKSTSKEWRLAADKYMLQKLYTLAAKCYRYAEQPNKERVALAYQTALEASRMMRNDPKAMRDKYFKAGAQFVECGDLHRAAMCFQNSQDFLLSAIAFERNAKFEEAANQYMRAQRANDACNCLEQMGMFGRAIRLLVDNELFDRAIDCLHRYEMEVQKAKREGRVVPSVLIENKPSDVYSEANLCYRSANSHHSKGKKTEAIAAIKRLRNLDDQIQFLRDHEFWEEAAEISGVAGKTDDATLFMLRSGNTDKALEYAQQGFHKELRALIHLTIARRHLSSDKDLEKIQTNATKALQVYTELTDYNGQAQAKFLLGKHKIDPKQLPNAYRDFKKVKPPNQAGELECLIVNAEAIVDNMKYYQEAIKIIKLGQNVLDVLLNKKTEDSDKYQLYMKFYGMEVDPGRHQVTWYPNLFQPCKEFLKISTTEEAKKFYTLDEADAVSALEEYLMSRLRKIYENSRKWLEDQVLLSWPCLRMQEGQSCGDDCKYMHRPYSSAQEEIEALNKIVHSVTLDSCMHAHVQRLAAQNLKVPDMKVDALVESAWKSVERLLEFVLPTYPSIQRGQQDHTQEIVSILRKNKDVKTQVERYLLHLWDNPGRVGTGKSTNILKERCKSVKWIVNTSFFASLLNLKLDVRAEVQKLEKELMNKDVKWATKYYKYALFTERSRKDKSLLVEAIGTRFLDSFQYLTKEKNPSEAIFPFTRMVSAFGRRNELSIMPKLDQFVFWIEFYVTLTWLFMSKAYHIEGNIGMFYMTNSYLFSLHIVGACTNCDEKIQLKIPQLVRQVQKHWGSKSVMERQNFFMNFLVGHNDYSYFSLIDQVNQLCQETPVRFWLAERILVLSALILLNTPGQYVSAEYEVPIRRELCKLTVNELMPVRLASLIESLKSSANYRDVAAALFNYFHQQGSDRLLLCQLSEQKKQQPWNFLETQLSDTPSMIFFEADIQAEIDKTSNKKPRRRRNDQPNNTASTELDEADRDRQEAQKAQLQEEKNQKEAIKKIVRLMQQNVMQKRLARKAYKTIEIDEMFKPYSLNKTSCGICGFDIQSVATDNPEEDKVKLFNEVHRQDPKHIENLHSLASFKKEYATMIHPSYQMMMRFIYENKVENSQIYRDIELETTKVLKAQKEFEATLRKLLHSRMWSDKETLRKAFTDFHYTFQHHSQRIEAVYKEYKQTATNENNNQTGRQDKKNMEESLVELTYAETAASNNAGLRSQFKKDNARGNTRSKN